MVCLSLFFACETSENNKIVSFDGEQISTTDVDNFITQQMDSLDIPGLSIAIINNGKVVYHNATGISSKTTKEKIDENSIFEAASLSKPVFAYYTMKMAEQWVIDLERPLYFYLSQPDMERDQRYKQVTAKMVLSHNTGFPNWRWFDDLPQDPNIERGDFFITRDPGSGFKYSGEAYQYLARVLTKLNFLDLNELANHFQQEVAIPIGMEHAYFVYDDFLHEHKVFGHENGKVTNREWGSGLPEHNSKVFNSAGGLHTEALSYARFLIAIMEEKGLHKNSFNEMLSSHTTIPEDDTNYTEDGVTSWGLGFGIKPFESDTLYMHGGSNGDFQSNFAFSKDKKYGYVFFTNSDQGNKFGHRLERFLSLRK